MKQSFFFLILFLIFSGCTTVVVNYVVDPAVDNLQQQTDLELVCEGAPAYLLIIDSLIVSNPESARMLMAGTQAYIAYAAALAACGRPERSAELSIKAKNYGLALLSLYPEFKKNMAKPVDEFQEALSGFKKSDVPALFWGGYGWANYILYQNGSPSSIADLFKIEQIMLKVLELDPLYYHGAVHLFLGVYYGSRPAIYGGKPEESRKHFEEGLSICSRHYLPVHVAYAEYYARNTLNRELFEKLLQEVLDFPLKRRPDLSLSNQIAKRRAKKLLDQADTYF